MSPASLRGVGVRFSHSAPALAEVDLNVLPGLTAVVGPNGAGKTTLLRVLAGYLRPDSGTAEVPRDRRRIGYIPQDLALDPEMTGRETLALLAALHGVPRKERSGRVVQLAESFGTARHLDRPVASWSGGLKRRLHLAAGMIHDPDLLLLDEPTAGLDLEGNDFLWAELERRAMAGRSLVVVTHDLESAARHAGRAVILHRGRIVSCGPPRDLPGLYRDLTGEEPE